MLPANTPKFSKKTKVVTLPAVTGVDWEVDGEKAEPGKLHPLEDGASTTVRALVQPGYRTKGKTEWTFTAPVPEDPVEK